MLTVTVYYYAKLFSFALSFLCFVSGIYIYIRMDIRDADRVVKGKENKNNFRILQNDVEVHTKETIWKK